MGNKKLRLINSLFVSAFILLVYDKLRNTDDIGFTTISKLKISFILSHGPYLGFSHLLDGIYIYIYIHIIVLFYINTC